jgi:putative membrane protein
METNMNKVMAVSATILAASFSFAPLAHAQQTPENAQQREKAEQRAEGAAAGQQMNADQHFIKEAAIDNQFEIQTSQFIEKQAQNPQVKQLAQRLIQDHQRAQQQLEQIARGMNMELPTQLEQWQQDKLQAMQQKHGEHLEMHYTFGQVGDHTTDILKYQYEAEHGQNAQVKQYAEQTIPILQQHLQLAEQTAQQWVPQARTAGEHIRGTSGANQGSNR